MKKTTLLYSILLVTLVMFSCEPIEDRDKMGSIVAESDLMLETYPLVEGGNKIVMKNSTQGVGSFWDYGSGYSSRQQDTILVPFVGEIPIFFTGISGGGTITTTRTVNVDKILFPVNETWNLLAGNDSNGKVWMWDYDDPNDAVWGNGLSIAHFGPEWAKISAKDMDAQDPDVGMNGTMLFDLNQKSNFTKKNKDGNIVEKGSFQFDMTKKIPAGDGTDWSIGQLTIVDASVMRGVSPNEGGIVVHTLEILKLTEDEMVLARVMPNGWEAWFWKFKVKLN